MKIPQMIASHLVDGPNPADRTLPLIDRVPMEQEEGVCEGGYMDVLTVTRKAYRGIVEAAVREALAGRDAEIERLRAQVAALDRERREAHVFLTGKFETGWCMSHPDGVPETELGKAAAALLSEARGLKAAIRRRQQ